MEKGIARKSAHSVIQRFSPLTSRWSPTCSLQPFIAFAQRFGSAATAFSENAPLKRPALQKKKPLHELDLGKVDERKKYMWADFFSVGSSSAFIVTKMLLKRIC